MKLSRLGIIMVLVLVCAFIITACTPKATVKESPSMGLDTPTSHAVEQPSDMEDPTDMLQTKPTTMVVSGQVKEVTEDKVHVTGIENSMIAGDVIANISKDTIFVDGETEKYVDASSLTVGMNIQLTLSVAMTRSMPPIANAYMIVANYSIEKQMQPNYIVVSEVASGADGAVRVLNQNKDTYVTIPSEVEIQSITADGKDTGNTAKNTELKEGDVVIAWYGVVALSYPAQAGALRAELVVSK